MEKEEKVEQKTTIVRSCENCPNLGNHVHFKGSLYALENDKSEKEFVEYNGLQLNN